MSETYLAFQHDGQSLNLETEILQVVPFKDLDAASQGLFKLSDLDAAYAVTCTSTIFHPQGGGQPSDIGVMKGSGGSIFNVQAVRMDAVNGKTALHVGHFTSPSGIFQSKDKVKQEVDQEKRLLYSRLHTAGHVLGAAVRHLLEKQVDGFDELKASHFPESAACEFQGIIEGKWKEPIQKKVDEYLAADFPVEVGWWTEDDFRAHGAERLIPDKSMISADGKYRVVNIKGAEIYPCGGTHVGSTKLCGDTVVKKISRAKGQSRVSYAVKG